MEERRRVGDCLCWRVRSIRCQMHERERGQIHKASVLSSRQVSELRVLDSVLDVRVVGLSARVVV